MVDLFGLNVEVEIIAVIFSLALVFFEIFQHSAMWFFSILSALFYAILYLDTRLYTLLAVELYNIGISVYGWYQFSKVKSSAKKEGRTDTIQIRTMSRKMAVVSLAVSFAAMAVLALVNSKTNNPYPVEDAFFGISMMLGLFYVSRQYIENWYAWLIGDALAVFFYFRIGLKWTSLLYGIYVISSVIGFIKWKKQGIRI